MEINIGLMQKTQKADFYHLNIQAEVVLSIPTFCLVHTMQISATMLVKFSDSHVKFT